MYSIPVAEYGRFRPLHQWPEFQASTLNYGNATSAFAGWRSSTKKADGADYAESVYLQHLGLLLRDPSAPGWQLSGKCLETGALCFARIPAQEKIFKLFCASGVNKVLWLARLNTVSSQEH